MKDFSAEVRATLDVSNFVNRATLLLDINQTSLESIVTLLLAKMLAGDERSETITKEGRAALMTHDSGNDLCHHIFNLFFLSHAVIPLKPEYQ